MLQLWAFIFAGHDSGLLRVDISLFLFISLIAVNRQGLYYKNNPCQDKTLRLTRILLD